MLYILFKLQCNRNSSNVLLPQLSYCDNPYNPTAPPPTKTPINPTQTPVIIHLTEPESAVEEPAPMADCLTVAFAPPAEPDRDAVAVAEYSVTVLIGAETPFNVAT